MRIPVHELLNTDFADPFSGWLKPDHYWNSGRGATQPDQYGELMTSYPDLFPGYNAASTKYWRGRLVATYQFRSASTYACGYTSGADYPEDADGATYTGLTVTHLKHCLAVGGAIKATRTWVVQYNWTPDSVQIFGEGDECELEVDNDTIPDDWSHWDDVEGGCASESFEDEYSYTGPVTRQALADTAESAAEGKAWEGEPLIPAHETYTRTDYPQRTPEGHAGGPDPYVPEFRMPGTDVGLEIIRPGIVKSLTSTPGLATCNLQRVTLEVAGHRIPFTLRWTRLRQTESGLYPDLTYDEDNTEETAEFSSSTGWSHVLEPGQEGPGFGVTETMHKFIMELP